MTGKGEKRSSTNTNFAHPWDGGNALQELMMYMSTQKLRTPKGLGWLREATPGRKTWQHSHWMIGDNEFRIRQGSVSQKPDAFRPNRAVELP